MTPETSRLIAETLRLDGEATIGPWAHDPPRFTGDGGRLHEEHGVSVAYTPVASSSGPRGTVCIEAEKANVNAALIALYRTSAPRLARIAKMQSEYIEWAANPCYSTAPSWLVAALVGAERQALPLQHVGRYVLTEIEKIAKGESDGIE